MTDQEEDIKQYMDLEKEKKVSGLLWNFRICLRECNCERYEGIWCRTGGAAAKHCRASK